MQKRKFSPEQKLEFIKESEQSTVTAVCRKYKIAPSLFYKWRKEYDSKGLIGLKSQYKTVDPEVKRLEEENERLKRIIANQALELEVKSELLKKSPFPRIKR